MDLDAHGSRERHRCRDRPGRRIVLGFAFEGATDSRSDTLTITIEPAADELSASTPCTDFTVGELETHLLTSLTSLTGLAGGTIAPAPAAVLESRLAEAARQAVETWMERGLEGTVQAGPDELRATDIASILSVEFLVHAWDFASATGQKLTVSDEVASYVLGLAEQIVTPELRRSAGFDPAIPVSADAPALDRLLAFSGRTA